MNRRKPNKRKQAQAIRRKAEKADKLAAMTHTQRRLERERVKDMMFTEALIASVLAMGRVKL